MEVGLPDTAILEGTDLELGLKYKVSGITTQEPGKVLLPTQELISVLRELGDETVEISSVESGIRIAGSSSKFDFPSEDPAEFPALPDVEATAQFHISAGQLLTMIRRTSFAAASENTRFQMCSVLMEFEPDGKTRFVATDGKRLALMPGTVRSLHEQSTVVQALVPPKAVTMLAKLLHDPEEEIDISLGTNEVVFRSAKKTLYSRLVEGRFPPWQTVVPPEPPIKIPLLVERFHNAVRQAKIVTNLESRAVKFTFEKGILTLRGQGADVGEAEIKMPVAYDRDSLSITLNPDFLADALRVMEPSDEVVMGLVDSFRPVILRTADDYAYVLMPVTRE
jgi:DNA polymerase-3 subunit beta